MITATRRAAAHDVRIVLPAREGQRIRVRISVAAETAYRSVHRTMTREEALDLAARLYTDHLLGIAPRLLLDSGEAVELKIPAENVLTWINRLENTAEAAALYGNILGR